MIERLKSFILVILVLNSLVLSGLLIFYSPDNTNISLSEYLPRIEFGQQVKNTSLNKPIKIIYHLGKNEHTIANIDSHSFKNVTDDMEHWTFYDFSQMTSKMDWKSMAEDKQGIEIVYSYPIPQSMLSSIYRVLINNIKINNINRLWLIKEDKNVKAYFISDEEDKVFEAHTSISDQELSSIISDASNQSKFTYHFSYPIDDEKLIKQMYYLPNEGVTVKRLRETYTTVSIADFIQLLFIDPSLVRKVDVDNKNNVLYTDGNRSLQFYTNDRYISYFQPVSDSINEINIENDLYSGIRFVNQHGGWDGTYFLEKVYHGEIQTLVEFRKYIEGYPLLDQKGNYGIIQMQLTDGLVSSFQRSMILIDRYIETITIKTMTNDQLMNYLKSQKINMEKVKNIKLGYLLNLNQDSIILAPYWDIELVDEQPIYIPASESGVQ